MFIYTFFGKIFNNLLISTTEAVNKLLVFNNTKSTASHFITNAKAGSKC